MSCSRLSRKKVCCRVHHFFPIIPRHIPPHGNHDRNRGSGNSCRLHELSFPSRPSVTVGVRPAGASLYAVGHVLAR